MVESCKKRLSIKLKRPIVKAKTVLDLRVTMLVHRFRTRAHILAKFHVVDMPLQLLNAKLISLLLMYITALLTSLISRALLQGALDKEASH
jgi:hypothetical protein